MAALIGFAVPVRMPVVRIVGWVVDGMRGILSVAVVGIVVRIVVLAIGHVFTLINREASVEWKGMDDLNEGMENFKDTQPN